MTPRIRFSSSTAQKPQQKLCRKQRNLGCATTKRWIFVVRDHYVGVESKNWWKFIEEKIMFRYEQSRKYFQLNN
jgi:hypothetical protein